jgi:hypothetical protein
VLNDFSTKEHATMYGSLFYIMITVFRFILSMVGGSPSLKIQYLSMLGIFNGFIGLFFIFNVQP